MKQKLVNFLKYNKVAYAVYYRVMSFCMNVLKLFVKSDDKLILFNSFAGRKYDDSPRAIYEELQERMAARVDSVLEYAESDDECRSTVLLRYLGEEAETDCGYCDVCVEKRRNENTVSQSHEDAVQVIVDAINDAGGSLPIAQIHSLPLTKHQLDVALEQLRSEGRLVIKGSKVALVK